MKRNIKKIYFLIGLVLFSFSCRESFLDEELVSTLTSDYFDTPQGLNECLNASYNALRWRFNGEHGYTLTNYGVDEMTDGNGPDMVQYNTYGDKLDPDETDNYDERFYGMTDVWQELYYIIKLCNIGLQNVETMTDEPFQTDELRSNAKAQFLFLRAFSYFDLVVQFGSIPLLVENTNKILTDLPKSSVETMIWKLHCLIWISMPVSLAGLPKELQDIIWQRFTYTGQVNLIAAGIQIMRQICKKRLNMPNRFYRRQVVNQFIHWNLIMQVCLIIRYPTGQMKTAPKLF